MQHWGAWQLYGVELNKPAAAFAREVKDLNVFPGTLLEANFPAHSFHVITLWNVLEHLSDPRKTLELINQILVPGGSLILSLPYLESFEAKRFGPYWAGWEVPRHLFLFPWKTLQDLLGASGFELKDKSFPYAGFGPLSTSFGLFLKSHLPESAWRAKLIKWAGSPLVHFLTLPYLYALQLSGSSSVVAVLAKRKS
jgi:SAM-dependent methyltransferase